MKVTQKNVRVFHIEVGEEELFLDYFRKNLPLLKEFFLLIEGNITKNIAFVLEQSGVCYKDITACAVRLNQVKKEIISPSIPLLATSQEPKAEQVPEGGSLQESRTKIFDRPIRSGEEIHESNPMVIFGRVNSGAKVFCDESMNIYGIIDGLVQCDGECIVLSGISPRGHLIFNQEIIDRNLIKENVLQKITIKEGLLEIKDIM